MIAYSRGLNRIQASPQVKGKPPGAGRTIEYIWNSRNSRGRAVITRVPGRHEFLRKWANHQSDPSSEQTHLSTSDLVHVCPNK